MGHGHVRQQVQQAVLRAISTELDILGGEYIVVGTQETASLLSMLIRDGFIDEAKLREAIRQRLCAIGRAQYEWLQGHFDRRPDHCNSAKALGYALLHGLVDDQLVRFDHDETAQMYRDRAEALLDEVLARIASGEAYLPTVSWGEDECHCECCG